MDQTAEKQWSPIQEKTIKYAAEGYFLSTMRADLDEAEGVRVCRYSLDRLEELHFSLGLRTWKRRGNPREEPHTYLA